VGDTVSHSGQNFYNYDIILSNNGVIKENEMRWRLSLKETSQLWENAARQLCLFWKTARSYCFLQQLL
jgi:hypothetical protein